MTNPPSRIVKYLLFLILFSICCAKSCYPNGFAPETESPVDFCGVRNNDKEYISYEFGFSKIISVYIVKNDTHCDVYISDGNKVNFSTTCETSPILNWAFEKAPIELSSARFVMNNTYEPFYRKLTVMVNDAPIIIDSSSMRIIVNEAVAEKIDELKRFIVSLWIDSLKSQKIVIKNSHVSLHILPDSIKEVITGKQFLLYDYGHHGKNWCLIYEDGDSYKIRIGTTRMKKPDLEAKIDTALLIAHYRDLIGWGMDTLPSVTKNMVWQYPEQWSTFYNSLSVFNEHSNCVFNSDNAIGFEGPDSTIVNDNFSRLRYLMYWLSAPDIRSLLPGFDDYIE